jgi:hypothetical protein
MVDARCSSLTRGSRFDLICVGRLEREMHHRDISTYFGD